MTLTTETFENTLIPSVNADLQLKDIIKTIPKECFQKNPYKAWRSLVLNSLAVVAGYGAIAYFPWFLLPVAWIFTGTALTGWFVIAHDCGHRSFAKRRWLNDLLGHLLSVPVIYPFHCWRILHDRHHAYTNRLPEDNAWQPWTPDAYSGAHPLLQGLYRSLRGRFWWLASIVHWATLHFDLSQFSPQERRKVKRSIASVIVFAAIVFPVLIATTGMWGFVKFWLLPWLVYHFWLSTFTLVHHTTPDIPFHPAGLWNAAEAQLTGTVHCIYPRWVEILCHDINVHIPHHVSVAIPAYNLRMAYASLRQNWGHYPLHETRFSWKQMKSIVDHCHLYHPEKAYMPFRDL